MKKYLILLVSLWAVNSWGTTPEVITVEINSSASQPNIVPYFKMLDIANQQQNKYKFISEFKPGAGGVIAIKTMDASPTNRLAITAPTFVENSRSGQINENDYVPVATQGDACWAVITNVGDTKQGISSLQGLKEITVGGTGYGNAAHLTALIIGEKYGFKVRYVLYKANYDALVNMTSGEPINFVIERVANYQTFHAKNPKLQILGITCPTRNPLMPKIKTLREQGFDTPTIFISTIANIRMPVEKRQEISRILEQAQEKLGAKFIAETSDMNPPQFNFPKISTEDFFNQRILQMKALTHRYEQQIQDSKQ
jgi:tripartite-type tricarboxylate transporter receptor subunit TctC